MLRFKDCKAGMRTYLLVAVRFDMPKIIGSSSTFIDEKFDGHNGRILRTGDARMAVGRLHSSNIHDNAYAVGRPWI